MEIDLKKLNQNQSLNLNLAIKAYNEKKLISSPSPPVLYIELTQNCIGRCIFCRGPKWVNNPSYDMKDEIFDILLEKYIPYAVLVDLRGWGESLMLSNFDEYVSKVAKFKPKIRITTALGCGNKRALQSLIDNDVYVSVSFDFAEKKLYEKKRKGIDYDIVIKNIEFLTQQMRKKGTLHENIRLAVAPLQGANLGQVKKIIKIAEFYGIPEVVLSQLAAPRRNFNLLLYHKRKTIKVLLECVEYAKKSGIKLQLLRSPFKALYIAEKAFDRCCHPWLYSTISYNGDFSFCDHIMGSGYRVGNVTEKKDYLWNGKKMQTVRSEHIQKEMRETPLKCSVCYTKGRYSDHEHQIDKQFTKWLVTAQDIEDALRKRRFFDIF